MRKEDSRIVLQKKAHHIVLVSMTFAVLALSLTSVPTSTSSECRESPVDKLRFVTIESALAKRDAFMTGRVDVYSLRLVWGMGRSEIEKLASEGFTVLSSPFFHMGFVGFNLQRPILDDVNFRHSLFHGHDQEAIVAEIYKYTATPVQSLVPPAQGGWMASDILKHPFNPGDKDDSPGAESVFGILKGAGYTYHGQGYGDLNAYWTDPNGNPLPQMELYTPSFEVAPTTAEQGARIVAEWNRCGLNNIEHQPMDVMVYMHLVFDLHDYDMFMIFWLVQRFPTHLYGLLHSWEYSNALGLMDPYLDYLTEIIMYSLNHSEKVWAAHEIQRYLADPSNTCSAFPYMPLHSRVCFDIYNPQLAGMVNSPGFGSCNYWTFMNMHWDTSDGSNPVTGENSVTCCLDFEPGSFNPIRCFPPGIWSKECEWGILKPVFDELIKTNPYTHEDLPWIAKNWKLEELIGETITLDSENRYFNLPAGSTFNIDHGMRVTFTLRDDVYWHDGNPFTAYDCEFALEFLRNNQIRIVDWALVHIVDVQVANATTFSVYSDRCSQYLIYDWSSLACIFPSQVWGFLDGQPLADISAYDPTANTTDTGPWPTPTCLIGTGPYIFDNYDPHAMTAEEYRNTNYFMTTNEIKNLLVDMFHKCGDVDRDGEVWAIDKKRWGNAFWSQLGDPNWDPDADVYKDDKIDFVDGSIISAHWGDTREVNA